MKKMISIMLLGIFVLSFGVVSAKTAITGKIYNADYSDTIKGAFVEVTCNGNVKNATSLVDGSYSVIYYENSNGCRDGDDLVVFASHPSYGYATTSGIVHDDVFGTWDLAVVNVAIVPEFGVILSIITALSSIFIFFIVRE